MRISRRKRLASILSRKAQIFLFFCSTFFALVCVEGITRWYLRPAYPIQPLQDQAVVLGAFDEFDTSGEPSQSYRVLHPYLGYVKNHAPETSYNKYGFLGPEAVQARSDDTVIIGLFGGSVAAQFYYKSGEYFTNQLSNHPDYVGKHIILVPMTLEGYKQPQHLLALTYFLSLGGEFDLIVTIDGVNELIIPSVNKGFGISSTYPLDWLAFSQMGIHPDIASLIYVGKQITAIKEHLRRIAMSAPIKHVSLGQLTLSVIDRRLAYGKYTLDQILHKKLSSGALSYQTKGPSETHVDDDQYILEQAQLWSRSSKQMYALATANKIRYYHYLQPNQYVHGSKFFTADELRGAYLADGTDGKVLNKGYPMLQSEGRAMLSEGVPYADLTGIFQHIKDTVYIDTCCHMNVYGNNIMADAIIRDITK